MTTLVTRHGLRAVVASLLFGVGIAAAVTVGLATGPQMAAPFWPGAALGLAAVALTPSRWWWATLVGVFAATLLGNFLGGRSLDFAMVHAGVDSAGALAGTAVLTQRGRRAPALNDVEDFLRLLGAGLLSGSVVMVAVLMGRGAVLSSPAGPVILATHLAGVLVLVPLLLVDRSRSTTARSETWAQALLLVAASVITLSPSADASIATVVPVLFLAWAALRFSLHVVVGELALFAVLVTAETVAGYGPFTGLDNSADPTLLAHLGDASAQAYLIGVAMLVLPLGISAQHTVRLLEQTHADGRLFRRNFTESLVGMVFFEPAPDGTDLIVADVNETALGILRDHGTDLIGRRLRELLTPGAEYDEMFPRLLAGTIDGWRTDCALAGGHEGRVTLQLSRLTGSEDPVTVAGQLLDVTTQYQAGRDLEMAQQLTATTLDTTACIIMVLSREGVVVQVNAATSTITGYAAHELLDRPVWDTDVAPVGAVDLEALMHRAHGSGTPVVHEGDVRSRSGERLRIVWNTNVVRSETGEPAYAVITGVDVTAERATRSLVEHLMEASFTTALVAVDTTGRITVVNSGLTHLLGYDREELVGQPFHRLIKSTELLERTGADSLVAAFATLVRGLAKAGETRPRDWTWVTRGGADKVVSMSLSIARDDLVATGGYLCVARDVTEGRRSQEMLIAALDTERTAVERLRALDQAKNQFVSTVSHELRTPVTSIVGYAEMMVDGSIVNPLPDQLPLLEIISRNGQRLIAMINDLLMLGGLDSGTVHTTLAPVDLAEVVATVEESVRPMLSGRGLDLGVERPGAAVCVLGDQAQLERVVTNLLSNALKFTDDGGRIGIRLSTEAEFAVIAVSDTGIGIPLDEQDDLFQRFFRSTTAQSRQIQGTGLGLSIVAEIVQSHGGSIEVTSAHLEGSTFVVRLPLAHAELLVTTG